MAKVKMPFLSSVAAALQFGPLATRCVFLILVSPQELRFERDLSVSDFCFRVLLLWMILMQSLCMIALGAGMPGLEPSWVATLVSEQNALYVLHGCYALLSFHYL